MNAQQHRVLVVENDPPTAMKFESVLREWGYQPLESAASAEEAIARTMREHPHLILMDIKLRGDLDGIQAAQAIREAGGHMPIVFITGYGEEYLSRACQVGFFGFMDKPIDDRIPVLKETVRTALEHYEYQQGLLAAERVRSIGYLAAGMLHTMNNLLPVCSGFLEALQNKHQNERSVEEQKWICIASRTASKAKELVEHVAPLLRGGSRELSEIKCDSLLDTVTQFMGQLSSIVAVERTPCSEPCFIRGEFTQMELLLLDLCFNAHKAMPTGGKLTLAAERCSFDPKAAEEIHKGMPAGEYVCIEVADTGCGITPEQMKRLFERGESNWGSGKGHGIGLWLLKQVITDLGGYVPDPKSVVGKGTTFRIYLPAVRVATGT